jgi:hypothetical protein
VLMSVLDRAGGAAGIVGVALALVFLALVDSGADAVDSSPVAAAALVDNRDSARLGAYLGLLASFLLIIFVSRLYGALRDVAGSRSWFPGVALVGGAVLVGVLLIEVGFTFAASELRSYGQDAPVARLFILWSWNSANLFVPGFAALVTGSTLVGFSAKAFPPWFRWLSAALLLLMLLMAAAGVPGLATAPGLLWVGLASILLTLTPTARFERPLAT